MHLQELLQAANPALADDLVKHPVIITSIVAALFSALVGAVKLMVAGFVRDVRSKLKDHEKQIGEHAVAIEASVRDYAGMKDTMERTESLVLSVRESVEEIAQQNAQHHNEFASRLGRVEAGLPNGELEKIADLLGEIKSKLS